MKHSSLLVAALALTNLALAACSDSSKSPGGTQATAAQPSATDRAAQDAPAAQATPAQATPAQGALPEPGALAANAPPADAAKLKASQDPANARGAGRYQGGIDKLESKHDLTKVKVAETDAAAEEDEHAGHDHGAETKTVKAPQDGSALLPAGQAQANKGRFTLTEGVGQVKDLGKMRQGDVGSFDFPFVSDGEEPLIITGVKPSCGCTKAEVVLVTADGTRAPYTKGDPIPVGGKFLLESEINTDGRQGPFNAQITLYGNDIRGAFNVRITAEIEPVLTILPSPTVFFGRITTKDRVEQTVTVRATRGEAFKLSLGQEPMAGPVAYELVAKEPDAEGKAQEWQVKIALGPNTEIGMRNYPLSFKSDIPIANPKYPSQDGSPQMHGFVVNVQAQVQGMVSAEPSFITFGMVRPGEPVERSLRIECHDDFKLTADIPVIVEGLQAQEFPYKDAFEVTLVPIEEGKAADLKVRLTGLPADLNGSLGGVLRVKVGHPFMEELSIRFSAVCRPAPPAAVAQPPGGQQQK